MGRLTRQSAALKKADDRAKAMQEHNVALDLGNGISLAQYLVKVEALRIQLEAYNALIAELDRMLEAIVAAENEINDFSENILMGVAVMYGKQSKQYSDIGGTRKNSGGWIDRN
jgi:hypothetical protein